MIDAFKSGTAPVFLICLKAGGFGLNLTEADYCFLLDPWWNPATEAQASTARTASARRRTVMVYRTDRAGHHRGEGDGAQGAQGGAVRRVLGDGDFAAGRSRPPTSAPCSK